MPYFFELYFITKSRVFDHGVSPFFMYESMSSVAARLNQSTPFSCSASFATRLPQTSMDRSWLSPYIVKGAVRINRTMTPQMYNRCACVHESANKVQGMKDALKGELMRIRKPLLCWLLDGVFILHRQTTHR